MFEQIDFIALAAGYMVRDLIGWFVSRGVDTEDGIIAMLAACAIQTGLDAVSREVRARLDGMFAAFEAEAVSVFQQAHVDE